MFNFPKGVLNIVGALKKKNFKAYVVGGSIRDMLMGLPVYDWDISTDASPKQVISLFKKAIPTGIKYGTVTVLLKDGDYEVTTFRKDESYTDGRRPDKVSFTKDITEDLSRRDFTINAMAIDPENNELIDPFGGREDIRLKRIKAVGDPVERFSEDGLRALRACRIAAKLGFEIEKKTFEAMSKTLNVFKKVSPERIHDELFKLMGAEKPSVGIELMRKCGILKIILPELESGLDVSQPNEFHAHDVYYHNIYTCDNIPKELPLVRIAALLHDISKPECKVDETFYNHEVTGAETAKKILKRLKFSNDDIEAVTNLIRNHMFNYTSDWSDSAVRRFIKRAGGQNIEDLFILRIADVKAMKKGMDHSYLGELKKRIKKVLDEENALSVKDLKVSGKDIMKKLKIKEGPKVGKILNILLERVLDVPGLNDKKMLLKIAEEEFKRI